MHTHIHTPPFKYTCMYIYTNHTHSTLYVIHFRVSYLSHQLLPVNNLRKRKKSLQCLSQLYLPYSHPTPHLLQRSVPPISRNWRIIWPFCEEQKNTGGFFQSPIPLLPPVELDVPGWAPPSSVSLTSWQPASNSPPSLTPSNFRCKYHLLSAGLRPGLKYQLFHSFGEDLDFFRITRASFCERVLSTLWTKAPETQRMARNLGLRTEKI